MTTIDTSNSHATLINVFTVEPDNARPLADLLETVSEETMRHVPGFISANIHISTDGTRVVNYAQWASAQAYQRMLQNPSAREHMAKAAELAVGFDPHLYTVESVHAAPAT